MALFDDDFIVSDAQNAAPVSPLVDAPGPGIGIAPDTQAPAPVVDAKPISPLSRLEIQFDRRNEVLSKMNLLEKFVTAAGEAGAALQGRASPLDARLKRESDDKLLRLQEIKIFNDTSKDVLEVADRLSGDARKKFIEAKAAMLDSAVPGGGDLIRSFSDEPEFANLVLKNAERSTTLKLALETGGIKAARDLMKSPNGASVIRSEIESAAFPAIRKKLSGLGLAAKELSTPEEFAQIMADGFISPAEAARINDRAKGHEKFGMLHLPPEEFNLALKNEDATFGVSGFGSRKTEQDILKERGKIDARDKAPITRTIVQGGQEIQQEWRGGRWVEVGRGPRFKPGDDGRGADRDRNTSLKLSDDFRQESKGFKEFKAQFSSATDYVADVTKDPKKATSSGDRSLAFTYAKFNDPGDKVAVRDLQDIQKLGGVPERISQAIIALAKGQMLPPRIRQQMHDEINRKFRELNAQQHATEREFKDRAQRFNLDPRDVVQPLALELRDKPKDQTNSGNRAFTSADEVRSAFKSGRIDRARAKAELKQFGFD